MNQQGGSDFEKFYVLKPTLLKRIARKTMTHIPQLLPESPLEKRLLRIMQNKKIGATTKWLMYKDALAKFSKTFEASLPTPPPPPPPPQPPQPPKETLKSHTEKKYIRKRITKDLETQTPSVTTSEAPTQTDSRQFYVDVFENNPEASEPLPPLPVEDQREEFTDFALDEFLKHLASEESGGTVPSRLVRRKGPQNAEYAVYDDLDTGSVIHVDIEKAKEQLYQDEPLQEPTPKKRFSPSKTIQLRRRTILKTDKYLNKQGRWATL